MVSVSEADSIIHQYILKPGKVKIPIDSMTGRIIADPVKADRDLPPFDRVAMDGIAIQYNAYQEGWRDYKLEGIQPAGQPRLTLKNNNNCIEVMTGAMVPVGCDTVIRYEDVLIVNGIAKIKVESIVKGQSIHGRAYDAAKGDVLIPAGIRLAAAEASLLATVGRSSVDVFSFPKTAIISTGNELVDIHDSPLPHQIRRSNSYALKTALSALGCESFLFHLTDDRNRMEVELIKIFADHQFIILSGGVSKGKFDLVPAVLEALGVKKFFHEVSQKPGKPFWFGISKKQIVFALPGNPVSTFLCFYRYIKPWLLKGMELETKPLTAILAADFSFPSPLTYFLQVSTRIEEGKILAYPLPGGGSGDFANLRKTDGFLELPLEQNEFKKGEVFPFISFRTD